MSHTPKNCIIVFMRAKHHMPVFLYDKACDIVQNLWRVSLKRKFNSKHVLDKNQGPKICSLEDREPWMNVTDQNVPDQSVLWKPVIQSAQLKISSYTHNTTIYENTQIP